MAEVIEGYAAVFYREGDKHTEFELMDGLMERIKPDAFNSALARGDDCIACVNHNHDLIFARTSNGTNVLNVDATGLHYRATPPDTQFGRDLLVQMERGDFTRSSFAFIPVYDFDERGDGPDIAWITDITRLYDTSPVAFPAYTGTVTAARAETRFNMPTQYPQNVAIRMRSADGSGEIPAGYVGDVFEQYRAWKDGKITERKAEAATRDAQVRLAQLNR